MRVLAQRYAKALADVALEHKAADAVKKDLAAFLDVVGESADLRNFLASPSVPRAAKQGVIAKLVTRLGASDTVRNLLFVLVENRRTQLLALIQQAYEQELLARRGIAEAHVVSARELSTAERAEMVKALERITGKRIEARYGEDPSLIGGAVVWLGSTVYDGSVRTQLNKMRERLAGE